MRPLSICQVCRRFGPVGGMERYVWELCRELAKLGHQVHVLCEKNFCQESLPNIKVHELGQVHPKPRWLAHIRFSKNVQQWLKEHRTADMIIHSHERTGVHDVTTSHGPPFASVRERPWWKRISLRIAMNVWLERREFCGVQVQCVIPNSLHIAQQLQHYYPEIVSRMSLAIAPGVETCASRPERLVPADGGVVGFMGKEWKRKGLLQVLEILSALSNTRPHLRLLLAGAEQSEVAPLIRALPFEVTLLGRVDAHDFYANLDVLLHPAINEPYGMVITEALSAGVPVVVSDVCGAAADVAEDFGRVLSVQADVSRWVAAVDEMLRREGGDISYQRSWHDVACEHEHIYRSIQQSEVI